MKNPLKKSIFHEWISSMKYVSCTTIPPLLLYCFSLIYFLVGVQIYQTIEIKTSLTNLSSTSLFIGSMLSTMGEKSSMPQTKFGKIFLIFYLLFGIPLTFVLLQQFSENFKRILRFIIEHFRYFPHRTEQTNFTISQMFVCLLIYLLLGATLFSADSLIDRIYFSFTSLFTIEFHVESFRKTSRSFYFLPIFYLIGLSLLIFWFQTIQKQIEDFLFVIARKSVMNFFDLIPLQIESDETNVDEIIRNSIKSTDRPIRIVEPFRRLSTNLMRSFKSKTLNERQTSDKNVQVNTIIRSCSRCNELTPSTCFNGKVSFLSTYSDENDHDENKIDDNGDDDDDDDNETNFPPRNLDQIRQRRATIVAKTILHQMATQPLSNSMEDFLPMISDSEEDFNPSSYQRSRSADSTPMKFKCSIKVSPPPSSSKKNSQFNEEFLEISKQISSLLVRSDEEL